MKTSQLILTTAALMVMVFAITIAMNFLGGDERTSERTPRENIKVVGPDKEKELPQLVFETTTYPAGKDMAKEWEFKHPGHADFWFSNPNPSEVMIGLQNKNCKCTDVSVFLSNPDWDAWRQRKDRIATATLVAGPIAKLFLMRQEKDMLDRESQLTQCKWTDRSSPGMSVPAGGRGWVRLSWTADKKSGNPEVDKAQLLKADFWMHHKDSGETQSLEARLVVFPILRLLDTKATAGTLLPAKNPGQFSFGTVSQRDLPRQVSLFFASTTRDNVALKPEMVPLRSESGSELIALGKPIPATREEVEKFVGEVQDGPLMSVYRLPVILMDKIGDRYCDSGMFRRTLRVTVNDGEIDPVEIPISGNVIGDVEIGGPDDSGRVIFGGFKRDVDKERDITLATELEDVNLELDKARLPEFLEVTLTKNKQPAGASRRTWKLHVTIPAGKVSGVFPRDNPPVYRDSAIYVKAVGSISRLIRIPVEGNAENR